MKTLVVYDTKHGATEEAALKIAEAIRAEGAAAETLDLRTGGAEKRSLAAFSAVALGGPFYMGRWSARAAAFARAREGELAGKRLAVFALGSDEKLGAAQAAARLPPSLAARAVTAHFGGRVDLRRLGGFERFVMRVVAGKAESRSTLDLAAASAFGSRLAKGAAQ